MGRLYAHRPLRILVLHLISLLLCRTAFAQLGLPPEKSLGELLLRQWTTEDGLPSNNLNFLLQSTEGYFWIASYNGLVRFDGRSFSVFDRRDLPELATDGFYELIEDDDQVLWIGTQGGGAWRYERRRFQPFDSTPPMRKEVLSILVDPERRLWVGTEDAGAYFFRGRHAVPVEHPSLSGISVNDILQDRRGVLYFASDGRGLVAFADGGTTTYTIADGLVSDHLTRLFESTDGSLWIGTIEGLARLVDGAVTTVPELAGHHINHLHEDGYGNLWLAIEQGLIRWHPATGEIERLTAHQGRPIGQVTASIFDREGSLWFTTGSQGLFQLRDGKFKNYTVGSGLAAAQVNVVYEAPSGDVLVSTDSRTLNVVRAGEVSVLELRHPLPEAGARDLHTDRRGALWIASHDGLLKVEGRRETLFTRRDGLPHQHVRRLHEDAHGRFWVGTESGVVTVETGAGGEVLHPWPELAGRFVMSIADGPRESVLIGARGSLASLDGDGTLRDITAAEGLPGTIVFSTYTDRAGAVWICTNGGLARLADGELRTVTSAHGLPIDSVFDLREDSRGFIWLSSAIGIARIEKHQLEAVLDGGAARVEAAVFDRNDGMFNPECVGGRKILAARDGRLWLPTMGGVAVIDPAGFPVNRVAPPVVVSRVTVDGEEVDLGETIEIAAGHKELVFELAALSFTAPEKVDLRYRLEGFDDAWAETGNGRSIRYTTLSHGSYTFRAIAANNDGIWNREGITLRFEVLSRFHETPLFYLLAAAATALLATGIHRWRVRAIQQRNQDLLRLNTEKQELIHRLELQNEEMEQFTYGISHDLKSPLITIGGFLGMAEKDAAAGDLELVRSDVQKMRTAADRMGELLDQLLELSRVGRVANPPRQASVGELAREAAEVLAGRLAEGDVELAVRGDFPTVLADRPRLYQVLQNLIENAAKFMGSQPRPRVEVGLRRDGGEVVYYVRDNGIGVEEKDREKVFGLCERLHLEIPGTGLGLAFVKRVVEVHGGRIWIESEGVKGQGSTFCFTLPGQAPAGST